MNAARGEGRVVALPVVVDSRRLRRRLALEEDEQRRELARLEERLRHFEDVERPAYESWLRLELGPALGRLEERAAELRAQQMMAARVGELVEVEGWLPREALHLARHGSAAEGAGDARAGTRPRAACEDRDAIEARRRAKRERKRAERKHARRRPQATSATIDAAVPGTLQARARLRMTELYRGLARRLHPDSPTVLRSLESARIRKVWAEVQAAYVGRSLERLLALSAWLETIADGGGDVGAHAPLDLLSLSERYERLRTLRRSRAALDRRLMDLAADPAWSFTGAPPRLRRRLKKEAARRLEDELARVGAALTEVEEWLAAIGPPRPPRSQRAR